MENGNGETIVRDAPIDETVPAVLELLKKDAQEHTSPVIEETTTFVHDPLADGVLQGTIDDNIQHLDDHNGDESSKSDSRAEIQSESFLSFNDASPTASAEFSSVQDSDSAIYSPQFMSPVSPHETTITESEPSSFLTPDNTFTESSPVIVEEVVSEPMELPKVNGHESEETVVVYELPVEETASTPEGGDACPVEYVVSEPLTDSSTKNGPEPTETVVRETDLSEAVAKAEEKVAEAEAQFQDVMGNGQLLKKTLKAGQPNSRPTRNSTVTIKCTASVLDSDQLEPTDLGKIVDAHKELRFTIGDLEVIQGLELVAQMMDIGEIAEVKVAPRFAYGEQGCMEEGVPPDAILLYSVELVKVEPPVNIGGLTVPERIALANRKIERGNFWYKRRESMLALSLYQRAVSLLEEPLETFTTPDDQAALDKAKARAYGNLSSAQVEEQIWDEALRSVDNALRYEPNNGKLLCRKIRVFREKGEYEEAVRVSEETIAKGSVIGDEYLKKAKEELANMRKKKKQADEREKALYQRMMGGSPRPSTDSSRTTPVLLEKRSADGQGPTSGSKKWLLFASAAAVAAVAAVVGMKYYQQHHH